MTLSDDYRRLLERRARRYRRRQRQLNAVSRVLRFAGSAAREARHRWWPSLLIAVLLDRDYEPRQR